MDSPALASPEKAVHIPVEEAVPLLLAGRLAAALVQVARHQRKSRVATQHALVVQPGAYTSGSTARKHTVWP
jgi:hypothetical protein